MVLSNGSHLPELEVPQLVIPIQKAEEFDLIGKSSLLGNNHDLRIDFFSKIFIDIGDSQSVICGHSMLMVMLNTCSRIIKKIDDW